MVNIIGKYKDWKTQRRNKMVNITGKRKWWVLTSVLLVAALLSLSGLQIADRSQVPESSVLFGVGDEKVITLGHVAYAAGDVDYTFDGVADDVQFQAALASLPATGGRLVVVSATQINFVVPVTRAIDNVSIIGSGAGTYFTNNAVADLFVAGGDNWLFSDLRTDAGSIDMGATTGWSWENVTIVTDYYAYRTPVGSTTAESWEIPVGRGATFVVAASNASAQSIAQADYACDGTDDQVEINAAIDALPAGGGEIYITEGTYDIDQVGATHGGITITKSNITITGSGTGTRLVLADSLTNVAVIYIEDTGIENITIRDLYINGSEATQTSGAFDCSGILARRAGTYPHNVLVENCVIEDCKDMAVMICAYSSKVLNCDFSGNFGSHVVELLGQDGIIDNCTLTVGNGEIADFGFGIDACDGWAITNNIIRIDAGGEIINVVIQDWPGSYRGLISNNTIINHGTVNHYMWFRGTDIIVNDNVVAGTGVNATYGFHVVDTASSVIFTNNILKGRLYIEPDSATAIAPIKVIDNIFNTNDTYINPSSPYLEMSGNVLYIAAGEHRFASGSLTAGVANAIGFAWNNPEHQPILIKKVIIEITTAGGTVGSHLDVGIADDAAGTNRGVEFFDDLLLNSVQVNDSWVGGDGGTQTKYVFCQKTTLTTDDWIVGQILDANAASLVGTYYIEYVGR